MERADSSSQTGQKGSQLLPICKSIQGTAWGHQQSCVANCMSHHLVKTLPILSISIP